jgi:hypothetical protein
MPLAGTSGVTLVRASASGCDPAGQRRMSHDSSELARFARQYTVRVRYRGVSRARSRSVEYTRAVTRPPGPSSPVSSGASISLCSPLDRHAVPPLFVSADPAPRSTRSAATAPSAGTERDRAGSSR